MFRRLIAAVYFGEEMEEEREEYFFLAARCSLHGRARLLPPSRGHSRVERPGKSVLFPAIASRRCVAPLKKGKKGEEGKVGEFRGKDAQDAGGGGGRCH